MSHASSLINRRGEDAELYNRTVSTAFVDRDAVTRWAEVTWSSAVDVKIFVDEVQTREVDSLDGGRVTEKRMKAFLPRCDVTGATVLTVEHMDQIIYQGETFEIESTPTPEYLYDALQYWRVNLVRVSQ